MNECFHSASFGLKEVLFDKYDVHSVRVKLFTTALSRAKSGFFKTVEFAEGKYIVIYNSILILKVLMDALSHWWVYGEGVMRATRDWFDASASLQTKQVIFSDLKSFYPACLNQSKLIFLQFLDNTRSKLDETISTKRIWQESRSENHKFDNLTTARSYCTTSIRVSVHTTRDALLGEKHKLTTEKTIRNYNLNFIMSDIAFYKPFFPLWLFGFKY